MFSGYMKKKNYSDRIYGYYFDKDNGAIINTSFSHEDVFFKQLQENVKISLESLIKILDQAYRVEMEKYSKTGGMFSRLPQNHPVSILLNLKCILEADTKFFGVYKNPLPENAIQHKNSFNTLDIYSKTLANLMHVDDKEVYKLLLKLNACKKQCHFVDPLALPGRDQFFIKNRGNEDHYKNGVEEIINFADFQKKIEKSIAYIVSKASQSNIMQYHN